MNHVRLLRKEKSSNIFQGVKRGMADNVSPPLFSPEVATRDHRKQGNGKEGRDEEETGKGETAI